MLYYHARGDAKSERGNTLTLYSSGVKNWSKTLTVKLGHPGVQWHKASTKKHYDKKFDCQKLEPCRWTLFEIPTVSIQPLKHSKSDDRKKAAFLKHRKLQNPDSDDFVPRKLASLHAVSKGDHKYLSIMPPYRNQRNVQLVL